MSPKFTYLLIDLLAVIIPFGFSFHPKIRFDRLFRAYLPANLISAFCFVLWDIIFTRNGVWGFNEMYISGVRLAGLPIEELLFFFCIPFACLFTYHCLNIMIKHPWSKDKEKIFTLIITPAIFLTGLFFWNRSYTVVTFTTTALLLFVFRWIFDIDWLGKLYRAYTFLLLPFFIVNGILTGTGLQGPIVWYDREEIIGFRLLTIPVEDIVYGFELVLVTIFFFEMFKIITQNRQAKQLQRKMSYQTTIR